MNRRIHVLRDKTTGASEFYLEVETSDGSQLSRLLPTGKEPLPPFAKLDEASAHLDSLNPDALHLIAEVADEDCFLGITPEPGKSYIVQGKQREEKNYKPHNCVLAGPVENDWAARYIATRSKVHHPKWRDPEVWSA